MPKSNSPFSLTSGKLWTGSQTSNADRRSFWQAADRTAAGELRSCPAGLAAPGPLAELHEAQMETRVLVAPWKTA